MLGFRVWHAQMDGPQLKLGSLFHNYIWTDKVVGKPVDELIEVNGNRYGREGTQTSLYQTEDIIPEIGFFAYADLQLALDEAWEWNQVIGLVSGYGKLHRHTYGFRSEYMQVLALLGDKAVYHDMITVFKTVDFRGPEGYVDTQLVLSEIASYYNIPIMSLTEMETFNV